MNVRGLSILCALVLATPMTAIAKRLAFYDSLSSFEAAAPSAVGTIDFSGQTLGSQSLVTEGSFFALPEPGATTSLRVADTAYGQTTYLDFASPAGVGAADAFAFGFETASVSAFGFELGTLGSDGKRVDGALAYVRANDPVDVFYKPFSFTPTGADVFIGFVGNPNIEIAGVILSEATTRRHGTALDVLDVYSTTPVPEPAAWTLMLLGVGLCGGVIRRGKVAAA